MEKHLLHPTILRAYDIRGIVNETLSYKDAYVIGLAFANILRFRNHGNKVVVGRDGRLTSPRLAKSLCDGLVAGGVKVCDIGCGSTPMLYYANMKLKADGAIQITGSHNPPTHNGFKMLMDNTVFYGNDIKELGEVCSNGINGQPGGSFVEIKIFDEYVSRILNNAVSGDYTVIWDCGNGAAGPATEAVTRQLSGHHKVLFSDIDGTFPNHHPNPVDPKTLDILRKEVESNSADLGIGFDGDGDRIGVIDAKGRQLTGDFLTAFLAQDIVKRNPNVPIILDIKSSDMAIEILNACGAETQLWKTGHSNIKSRMLEVGSALGGEMSGHIFIKDDFYGFDDALYVAIRVLSQMAKTGETITDFIDRLATQYATPELRFECDDSEKFGIVELITLYAKEHFPDYNLTLIDGVRVRNDDGWWLVRASNTEAALVVRAEARSEASLSKLTQDIRAALNFAGQTVGSDFFQQSSNF